MYQNFKINESSYFDIHSPMTAAHFANVIETLYQNVHLH
jgi:hypothetical protein